MLNFYQQSSKSPLGTDHGRALWLQVPTRQLQRLCEQTHQLEPRWLGTASLSRPSKAAGRRHIHPSPRSSGDAGPCRSWAFGSVIKDRHRSAAEHPQRGCFPHEHMLSRGLGHSYSVAPEREPRAAAEPWLCKASYIGTLIRDQITSSGAAC